MKSMWSEDSKTMNDPASIFWQIAKFVGRFVIFFFTFRIENFDDRFRFLNDDKEMETFWIVNRDVPVV
jgi:hypothetical protein